MNHHENRITLFGVLFRDPELRTDKNGKAFCVLAVAVAPSNRSTIRRVQRFRVVARREPELLAAELRKGQSLAVTGSMHSHYLRDGTGELWEVVAWNIVAGSRSSDAIDDAADTDQPEGESDGVLVCDEHAERRAS